MSQPAHPATRLATHRPRTLAFATLGSSVLANAAVVIATALLVRLLGSETYGRLALLTNAASALSSFSAAGLALYVVRSLSLPESAPRGDLPASLRASLDAAQALALIANITLLAYGIWGSAHAGVAQWLLTALALHFITADAMAKNRLIGNQQVLTLAATTVTGTVLACGLQLLGAHLGGGSGYLIGYVAGTATQAACSKWGHRGQALPALDLSRSLSFWKDQSFLRFVAPATLAACLGPIAHWLAFLIAAHRSGAYAGLAALAVAMQFFNLTVFVPTVMNKIVLPRTLRATQTQSLQMQGRSALADALRIGLWGLLPVIGVALGASLLQQVYRFEHPQATLTLWLFVLAGMISSMAIPLANHFVAQGAMGKGLLINLCWAAIYLTLAMLLPGDIGAVGGALTIAYTVSLLIAVAWTRTSGGVRAG